MTKLGVPHASRRGAKATVEKLPELTDFLPVSLKQLYEHDLLKVGQSLRHTAISCCMIIKEINNIYYQDQSLSTTGLVKKLLADGYIKQDILSYYTILEVFDDSDLTKVESANIVNNAANLKVIICKLLSELYVTPGYKRVCLPQARNNLTPEESRMIGHHANI